MKTKEKQTVVLHCGMCGHTTIAEKGEKVYCPKCADQSAGYMKSLMYEKQEED